MAESVRPNATLGDVGNVTPSRKSRKKGGRIGVAVVLVIIFIVIGVIATRGTDVTQTQSYKDGLAAGGTLGEAYAQEVGVFGGSIKSFCESESSSMSDNNNRGQDNQSEWTQGCIQGLTAALGQH